MFRNNRKIRKVIYKRKGNDMNIKKENFKNFKNKNLEIRHLICDLIPMLDETTSKRYKEFFKYSENLDKRLIFE